MNKYIKLTVFVLLFNCAWLFGQNPTGNSQVLHHKQEKNYFSCHL